MKSSLEEPYLQGLWSLISKVQKSLFEVLSLVLGKVTSDQTYKILSNAQEIFPDVDDEFFHRPVLPLPADPGSNPATGSAEKRSLLRHHRRIQKNCQVSCCLIGVTL